MSITPKNWKEFQHYKDRSPSWIKLHRGLLDDFQFSRLPVASRALAPMLWLLASEYEDGEITASVDELAFRFRMPVDEFLDALSPLIDAAFFSGDTTLAECKQDACLEKRREENKIEKESRAVAKPTRTDDDFEEFWKSFPRRDGANPKDPAKKLFMASVKAGEDPQAIIAGARRCARDDASKVGTPYIPQAVKWLRDKRWRDYSQDQPAEQEINWDSIIEFKLKTGIWSGRVGPPPGEPGCRVPADLLIKHGLIAS